MTTNTALQVTNFNFYGDDLIALRDNATGEVYAAINHILRNIGFTETQIRKKRDSWVNDSIISKGISKFNIPNSTDIETDQKRAPLTHYDTYCISNRKLPLALAKINITSKMKLSQPDLALKLELYQDKCADVLASVFIDRQIPSTSDISPILESIAMLDVKIAKLQKDITQMSQIQQNKSLPEKKYSRWKTNMFQKLKLLQSHVNENSDLDLTLPYTMKLVFDELQDTYNIDLSDYDEMYKCEYGLDMETKVQILDVIDHYKDIRDMFTQTLESIFERLHLQSNDSLKLTKNIFDELADKLEKIKK